MKEGPGAIPEALQNRPGTSSPTEDVSLMVHRSNDDDGAEGHGGHGDRGISFLVWRKATQNRWGLNLNLVRAAGQRGRIIGVRRGTNTMAGKAWIGRNE